MDAVDVTQWISSAMLAGYSVGFVWGLFCWGFSGARIRAWIYGNF